MRNELRKTVKENSRQKNSEISAKKVNKKAKSNGQDDDIIKVNGLTVSKVQAALKKAGFYNGNVDGKIGPKTKAAIKEFQRKNNLKVDGVVGRGTWAKLKKNI
ncbi:MAG: peptidoglycan-binding protein [Candidatus Omnitrophica bacterium]|nr:peptidoglycan-binding protein [Candidatus Omnitrophota bacterium]